MILDQFRLDGKVALITGGESSSWPHPPPITCTGTCWSLTVAGSPANDLVMVDTH